MKLKEGEIVVMVTDGKKIVIEKPEKIVKGLKSTKGIKTMTMSEHALKKD